MKQQIQNKGMRMELTTDTDIRKASSSDMDSIRVLLISCELTLAGIEDTEFWTINHSGGIIACVGLETKGKDGLLRSLALSNGFRKSGFGKSLVVFIIQEAKNRSLRNLFLLTSTAKDYFPRFGFYSVSRSDLLGREIMKSKEIEACSETCTLMKLELFQGVNK